MPISRQQSFVRNLLTNLGIASSPKVFRQTNKQNGRKTNNEGGRKTNQEPVKRETGTREKKGTILTLSELQLRLLQLMRGGTKGQGQREASKGKREGSSNVKEKERKKEKQSSRVVRSQTLPSRPVNSCVHLFDLNNTPSHTNCI